MRRITVAAILFASLLAGYFLSRESATNQESRGEILTAEANAAVAAASAETVDFTLPDMNGDDRQLSSWAGKLRLVNFWATWCVPCRREIPLLKEIQATHGSNGIQVIGVAVDDPEPVAEYAAEIGFNYPILIGGEKAIEAAEGFGVDFMAMPLTFIVAPDGELLNAHVGEFKSSDADAALPIMHDLIAGKITNKAARRALSGT